MSQTKNYVYFSFDAHFFDPNVISAKLDIEPTSISIKKDPVPIKTSWNYRIIADDNIDLESPLQKLIDLFESKVDLINELKEKLEIETRLQFVIYIDMNLEVSTPFFGLNNRVVDFIGRTKTEVDFDLYKERFMVR
jgi:hypothetical protein